MTMMSPGPRPPHGQWASIDEVRPEVQTPLLPGAAFPATSTALTFALSVALSVALCVALSAAVWPSSASAAIDPVAFNTPEQLTQYRRLIAEFRCPKCLNQNLAESDAPIAQDLRMAVRELVEEGRSDDEIRRYMQERYGDFVLYKPPLRADTLLLWFGPLLLGVIALVAVWRVAGQRSRDPGVELDAEAQARVRSLLDSADNDNADAGPAASPGRER